MMLKDWPLELAGSIKNISKEQAKEMFNFDLPDNATGITFRQGKTGTHVMAYIPGRHKASPALLKNAAKLKIIHKITPQIRQDIIHKVWNPIVKKHKPRKYSSGCEMFTAYNLCRDIKTPEDLLISIGTLPTPTITNSTRKNENLNLNVTPLNHKIAVLLIDKETYKTQFFPPASYKNGLINLRTKLKSPIVFVYAKYSHSYSKSVLVP